MADGKTRNPERTAAQSELRLGPDRQQHRRDHDGRAGERQSHASRQHR
ncbi:hypothetical protein ACVOMS_25870 [Bradyrhizobium guangxiense]